MSGNDGQGDGREDWAANFIRFIAPRLKGDEAEQEQSMEMILSALEMRYREGIKDAAWIARRIAEQDENARRVATVFANSFDKLEQMSISKDDGRRLAAMDERRAASEEASPEPRFR